MRNIHEIAKHIKNNGKLPVDRWGQILEVDDLMVWFGLNEKLTDEEQEQMKIELAVMVETERFIQQQFNS